MIYHLNNRHLFVFCWPYLLSQTLHVGMPHLHVLCLLLPSTFSPQAISFSHMASFPINKLSPTYIFLVWSLFWPREICILHKYIHHSLLFLITIIGINIQTANQNWTSDIILGFSFSSLPHFRPMSAILSTSSHCPHWSKILLSLARTTTVALDQSIPLWCFCPLIHSS